MLMYHPGAKAGSLVGDGFGDVSTPLCWETWLMMYVFFPHAHLCHHLHQEFFAPRLQSATFFLFFPENYFILRQSLVLHLIYLMWFSVWVFVCGGGVRGQFTWVGSLLAGASGIYLTPLVIAASSQQPASLYTCWALRASFLSLLPSCMW